MANKIDFTPHYYSEEPPNKRTLYLFFRIVWLSPGGSPDVQQLTNHWMILWLNTLKNQPMSGWFSTYCRFVETCACCWGEWGNTNQQCTDRKSMIRLLYGGCGIMIG